MNALNVCVWLCFVATVGSSNANSTSEPTAPLLKLEAFGVEESGQTQIRIKVSNQSNDILVLDPSAFERLRWSVMTTVRSKANPREKQLVGGGASSGDRFRGRNVKSIISTIIKDADDGKALLRLQPSGEWEATVPMPLSSFSQFYDRIDGHEIMDEPVRVILSFYVRNLILAKWDPESGSYTLLEEDYKATYYSSNTSFWKNGDRYIPIWQ